MALITATTAALVSIGIGAATAAIAAPIVVSTAVAVGATLLADALAPAEPVTQAGAAASGFEKEVSTSTVYPRTWTVGRVLTAGSHVYSQVSDIKSNGDPHGGPNRNRYYDVVHALADHPCEGLVKLHLNDKFQTGIDIPTNGTMGSSIPSLERRGQQHGYVKFHDGAVDQAADERLVQASRKRDDFSEVWTNSHRLRGVAYLRCTFKYDERKHTDWPEFSAVIDGAPLYDLRKDGSEGGSGSHRIDDEDTWEYSANQAVAIGHLLLGYTVDGKHHVGLQGTTHEMLDLDSFHQAADDCNDDIPLKGGGTEKRYRCGFEFTTDLDNAAIVETLLSSCAGRLCWTGARWRLFVGKEQSVVASITDADIRIDLEREFDPKTGLADLVNKVTAQYTDPDEDWNVVAAQPRTSSADQEEDGDRELTLDLSLHAVQSNTQAQRIMEIARRQAREQKRHRIALLPKFIKLEVGDWIEWTSARWGYVVKKFRIDNMEIAHDLTVFVHLAETNDNIFAWDEDVDELGKNAKDLAPGGDPDDDVGLALSLYDFVDRPYTKRAQVGIGATWVDLDDRTVRTIEFQWQRDGGSRKFSERVDADELVWETTKSIREETAYRVRARPRFKDGSYGDWTAASLSSAPTITSGLEFDPNDAPVPVLATIEGLIRPNTGDKRRALISVAWTQNSMRWPTSGDPVDSRLVGLEIRYRQAGETDTAWQSETSRDLTNRSFRVYKGIKPATTYEYQVRFLFRRGDDGNWSTLATVVVPDVFDAGTAPVPNMAGATITPVTITGSSGTERAAFRINLADGGDDRIRGVLLEYRKSSEADAEATQKFFKGYATMRVTEGVHRRQSYDFRAAFVFEYERQGNFSPWRTNISASDARTDDPDTSLGDNKVFNHSFERLDDSGFPKGWTQGSSTGFSVGNTASNRFHRDAYLQRVGTGSGSIDQTPENYVDARPGQVWTATTQMRRTGAATFSSAGIRIVYYDKDLNVITFNGSTTSSLGASWEEININETAPANTAFVSARLFITGQASGGSVLWDYIELQRQRRTREIESGAITEGRLADGAIVEGKFNPAVVLPVAAKVRIDGSTTIDANKAADIINAVPTQRVNPNSVRASNDPLEPDTLGSLLEGPTGSRTVKGSRLTALSVDDAKIANLKRNKVYIDSAGAGARTLADVMDNDGKLRGTEVLAKSIDKERLANRSTADMAVDIKDNQVTISGSNHELASVTIEVRKASKVLLTGAVVLRAQGGSSDATVDVEIVRSTGGNTTVQKFNSLGCINLRTAHAMTTMDTPPNGLFGAGDDATASITYFMRATWSAGATNALAIDRSLIAMNLKQAV